MDHITLADARRIALAAQGFDRPRPQRVTSAAIAETIRRLALVQLDFVNVTVPAHYQVIFSRLGAYDRTLLDDLVYRSGKFTEQWAHEASIVPVESWPLLQFRRDSFRLRPWGVEQVLEKCPEYAEALLREIQVRGAITADQAPNPQELPRRIPGSWHRSVPRAILEAHFARGRVCVANRLPNFARSYDLADRVIGRAHFEQIVPSEESRRRLLAQAARACGVATAKDLSDYFHMKMGEAKPRVLELVESGELCEVRVESWREPAYLHRDAPKPRPVKACALLAPFDPLIWFRPRVARLFGFEYRFEIFVPDHKRKWGVYVLPFLYGEKLVARVDLKADREKRKLVVVKRIFERGCKTKEIAAALDGELAAMSKWLFGRGG